MLGGGQSGAYLAVEVDDPCRGEPEGDGGADDAVPGQEVVSYFLKTQISILVYKIKL